MKRKRFELTVSDDSSQYDVEVVSKDRLTVRDIVGESVLARHLREGETLTITIREVKQWLCEV